MSRTLPHPTILSPRTALLAAAFTLLPLAAQAQSCSLPEASSAADCGEGMVWSEESGLCLPLMS
ncbi:hypothetical protein HOY34_09000 [Xinfangfangia sp. D13-10-4-6]|uniref:hypothetical protein n=1 Tax=Pseudogemmobacter hezensis TaxID=2737662 RepID=UPI001554DDFA|nr:hypothetical protein [Pseudogemmobacter hezensis]NPD15335.1 hypothetical protein [Pseudogemmobacter hezensis]